MTLGLASCPVVTGLLCPRNVIIGTHHDGLTLINYTNTHLRAMPITRSALDNCCANHCIVDVFDSAYTCLESGDIRSANVPKNVLPTADRDANASEVKWICMTVEDRVVQQVACRSGSGQV